MDLPTYERLRVIRLLHRFFRTSLQVGRMPSIISETVFRARLRGRPSRAFEDAVIFVCDVERCLRALEGFDQRLVAVCIFEDRSEWEAARRLRAPQSYVSRRLGEVLDLLHETFCRIGLLPPVPEFLREQSVPDAAQGRRRRAGSTQETKP